MSQQQFHHLRPQVLVRMSKDDIIYQYDIFPIKIGQGNDAVVYKAKQNIQNGQWRAIKKIHRKYVQKQEYLKTQIDILKKLDHPGILKIYEVFDDSQYIFIVTELCQGTSLLKQLQLKRYFEQQQAKQIFKKILEIITYCHQNKIIHRDLKLQNLVFAHKDNLVDSLKLIDFGMSFKWETHPRIEIKNTFSNNKVVGTIYYMAPEVYQETYDFRVDIWALGVILFFLLTGQLPFNQDEDQQLIEAIQKKNVPYEKLTARNCSKEVKDLLKRIFKEQKQRISIQQILKHDWIINSQEQQLKINKQTLHYFSLIPFKEFDMLQDYYKYYQEKIAEISDAFEQQNFLHRTLNWNNMYEFNRMSSIDKGIHIFLCYRMSFQKIQRYVKIFNHFKTKKKEMIHIQTLYEHLNLEYEEFVHKLKSQGRGSKRKISLEEDNIANMTGKNQYHGKFSKRKNSSGDQIHIYSVKKIYKDLLNHLQKNKHHYIGFTQFISWIADRNSFETNKIQSLKKQIQKYKNTLALDTPQQVIQEIHKIVRHEYFQRRKCKSQYVVQVNNNIEPLQNRAFLKRQNKRPHNYQLLNVNVSKQHERDKVHSDVKREAKKSIKQGIFESFSPRFPLKSTKNKDEIKNNNTNTSRLLQNKDKQSGFMFGLNKIIQFF